MPAMFNVCFRFRQTELDALDALVRHERDKGPSLWPAQDANRTSVLKALVERETIRLRDEAERIQQQLEKAAIAARPDQGELTTTTKGNKVIRKTTPPPKKRKAGVS